MSETDCKVPVAFLIFNRPDTTKRVFEQIRHARPRKLFVIADGPRLSVLGDADRCAAARAVIDTVDWPCELIKNYAESNLGCRKRVSSGLDRVFSTVNEAIILEDDCLPHPDFFRFCEQLLKKYRDDQRIMMISGDNFQFARKRTPYSYYFSKYPHIWGWATWRRAWKTYDIKMSSWPEIRDGNWLNDFFRRKKVRRYWRNSFNDTYYGLIDTWDHQFMFACIINAGLCILPNVNLVSNIGFGIHSTRTKKRNKFSEITVEKMKFPLQHPPNMIRDERADRFTENGQYSLSLLSDWFWKTIRLLQRNEKIAQTMRLIKQKFSGM